VTDRRADALRGAACARSLVVVERARRALRELERRGSPISFQAVAAEAGVSRAFLYGHDQLRAAIEQLREEHQHAPSRLPRHERASEESLRARLRGALEENKRLRCENAQLRDELAHAHGEVRELKLASRHGSTG
jgi:predicted RNase H-like nuclease (RuvC/YqgF family)